MPADPVLPPALVPQVHAPYRVVPALRPLVGPATVRLDAAWPAAVRRRLERLTTDRAGVVVRAPDLDEAGVSAALREAWALLDGVHATPEGRVRVPHLGLEVDLDARTCQVVGPSRYAAATDYLARLDGLDLLVDGWLLACSDDLVVLRRTGRGKLETELLAVAFPSGWPPRSRAGVGLTTLHAPVADAERLQRAAPALTEALLTKGPLRQHVWGLDPSSRLDHDPSARDAADRTPPGGPGGWWLRVEEQTNVPLPQLERALFLIRPHLRPLTALDRAERQELATAIVGMSPASRAYKGIAQVADELVDWLGR